jgi:glutamate decarboxylase
VLFRSSRLGHYSLAKSGGVLGIGNSNIVAIPTDDNYRLDVFLLEEKIKELQEQGRTKIIAVIGIAGTTETGTIDPLPEIAKICRKYAIHFHVDAAWGGPTMMSERYRHLLAGIELADSVTIDAHKQFYLPMTCGMVHFRDPHALDRIAYYARYINRPGSVDLGIRSLSGSREANSLILDSALKIMGTSGYGLLLEYGLHNAREFAREIERRQLFELTSEPVLNILTYRLLPPELEEQWRQEEDATRRLVLEEKINDINRNLQRSQREAGMSFVSRTTLAGRGRWVRERVVLRAVIMNPMTTIDVLNEILDEQEELYRQLG